ncbi:MAG: nitrous oxide reductase family maturation protein NosD [Bacteroidota bacterium]
MKELHDGGEKGYSVKGTAGIILLLALAHVAAGAGDLGHTLAVAHPGDTLIVPAGTYAGNLLIDKRLVLIGTAGPVVRGEGEGSVLTITADSCVVRGLVLEHSGTMLVDEDAGILVKSNGNLIEGNTLRDVLFGIYLLHAEGNIVRENVITGRAELELGERGSGIHIWNAQHNAFFGNCITDVRDGFYIQNANHSSIERNEAFGVRYGVHYMYADSNVFLRNTFHHNVAGAAIMYSRGITIRHNVFSHNRGFASFGILFQDCHGVVADSNVISDNVVGMFFEASTGNRFLSNVIAQNDVALQMFQNSVGNTFSGNNFIHNVNLLTVIGKQTGSRWNENGRGNFWSQYDGYDLDGDGIGDVPMKIQNVFGYLEGRNANTRLYLYSPAAQALAVAAETFPIMEVSIEADERPLLRPADLRDLPAVAILEAASAPRHGGGGAWIAAALVGAAAAGAWYRVSVRRKKA